MTEVTSIAEHQESEKIFENYFPEGKIQNCNIEDLPEDFNYYFTRWEYDFLKGKKDFREVSFKDCRVITHKNGEKTYLLQQESSDFKEDETDESTHLIDINEIGELVGYGRFQKVVSSNNTVVGDKPFVSYTRTLDKYERQGYAIRRLRMMNALSQMYYNLPLYSGYEINEEAGAVWEKLVENGEALLGSYKPEGRRDIYCFGINSVVKEE